jgi:protein-S-isoprenylcysteine O-methyltransferase Ste14
MNSQNRATGLLFRFRIWILVLLYFLGFWAPWDRLLSRGPELTLWLSASTTFASVAKLDLALATEIVTFLALACCASGTLLRLWGTACLSPSVMKDSALRGEHLVAEGPYGYVRNPLYLGSFLFSLGVSILMPTSGALVFLVGVALLYAALIPGEEFFLRQRLGDAYRGYCERVPRLLPRLRSKMQDRGGSRDWVQAVLAEIFQLSYTLCFAILAWHYNAFRLIQCLIVCFGISLVLRAGFAPRKILDEKSSS